MAEFFLCTPLGLSLLGAALFSDREGLALSPEGEVPSQGGGLPALRGLEALAAAA